MNLKSTIDSILSDEKRTIGWLAGEMDRTPEGLKLSLSNETIKYSDLKKLADILNIPITMLFEGDTTIQKIKGNNNNQAGKNIANQPDIAYNKIEIEGLRKQVALLESQLADKDKIIQLLSNK